MYSRGASSEENRRVPFRAPPNEKTLDNVADVIQGFSFIMNLC